MVRAALDVGYRFGAGATGTTRAASRQTGKKQIPAAQRVASQISRPAKTPCPSHNFAFARAGSYVSAIHPTGVLWISYKMSQFKSHYIIYWEADEKQPSNYDNVASFPYEGITRRHNGGAVMGLF